MAGQRILPLPERESAIGQLCETAFYMGASFVGGQVSDAIDMEGGGVHVDDLTRETLHMLTSMAVAAMQTSGEVLVAQGGENDVEP